MHVVKWMWAGLCLAAYLCAGCFSVGRHTSYVFTPDGPSADTSPPGTTRRELRAAAAPAVKAGWADDNAQYNRYLHYLDRFAHLETLKLDVNGRFEFTVLDADGKSVPNCPLTVVAANGRVLCRRTTYADGRAMFFPYESGEAEAAAFRVEADAGGGGGRSVAAAFDLHGPRSIELRLSDPRPAVRSVPLDVALLIDTTGSMGDEIDKLKRTLAAIHFQIRQMTPKPDVRFSMVEYRDRGDAYVTRVTPFTPDVKSFSTALHAVWAGGGGDAPEDLQEALRKTKDLAWRADAVRMAFLLGDARPHIDYGQPMTYVDFMQHAAAKGIKIITIGASGLSPTGEYVFRQLAQYTRGLFVFLTYGETGESGDDSRALVSHHTGENWQARNLDEIIVKAVRRELSHLSATPVRLAEDYFQARAAEGVAGGRVLEQLFTECARQLVGFSKAKIEKDTPVAVLPSTRTGCGVAVADALGDRLGVALAGEPTLKLVERKNLQDLLDEMRMSELPAFDARLAPQAGRQLAAKILVLSKIARAPGRYDMFVKMVRVATGEVLSATLLKIDAHLVAAPAG